MLKRSGKAVLIVMLTGFIAATATSVMAETQWEKDHPRRDQVNDRLKQQNQRIKHEVKEGEMSKKKAHRLHKKDRQIKKEERTMARENGGTITKAEQKKLNQQENSVSKQIGQ